MLPTTITSKMSYFREMTHLDDLICDKLIDILNMGVDNIYCIKFDPHFKRSRHAGASRSQVTGIIRHYVKSDNLRRAVIEFLTLDLSKTTNAQGEVVATQATLSDFRRYLGLLYDNKHFFTYFQDNKAYANASQRDKKEMFYDYWISHYKLNVRTKKDLLFLKEFKVPLNRSRWLRLWCWPKGEMDEMNYWLISMDHVARYMKLYSENPGYEINETLRYKEFLNLLRQLPSKVEVKSECCDQGKTEFFEFGPGNDTNIKTKLENSPDVEIEVVLSPNLPDSVPNSLQSSADIEITTEDAIFEPTKGLCKEKYVSLSVMKKLEKPKGRYLAEPDTDFSVISLQDWKTGDIVQDCTGFMVPIPEEVLNDFTRDFSVVYLPYKRQNFLLLGPVRFINHDCNPNVKFLIKGETIQVQVLRPIGFGQEILVEYGEHYFGKLNEDCLCLTCEQNLKPSFVRLQENNLWMPKIPAVKFFEETENFVKSSIDWLLASAWYQPAPSCVPDLSIAATLSSPKTLKSNKSPELTSSIATIQDEPPKRRKRFQLRADKVETNVFPRLATDPATSKLLRDLEGRHICYYCRINVVREYKKWNLCHRCYKHQTVFQTYWPARVPPTYENY